jgi:ABC-type transport system substrate-binding protein
VQQAVAILLQNGLRAVDERYSVEPVGLPRSLYVEALDERRLPLAVLAWSPELPDPHHWLAPAYEGPIAAYQSLPLDLQLQVNVLLEQGRTAVESSERLDAYGALSQFRHDAVPFVLLPRPTERLYQRRWVRDWIFNPADPLPYYYAYALTGQR